MQLGERGDIEIFRRVRIARRVVVNQQLCRRLLEPRITALVREMLRHCAHTRRSQECAAVFPAKRRNGQTP